MEDSNKSFLEQLGVDAEGFTAGTLAGAAVSGAALGTAKMLNKYTPQDYPIGELFSDFILDSNNLRNGPNAVIYKPSIPRVASDLTSPGKGNSLKGILTDLFAPSLAGNDSIIFEPHEINDVRELLKETGMEAIGAEMGGITPPDKLSKIPGLLDKVIADTDQKEISKGLKELIKHDFMPSGTKSPANILTVPRNNMTALAHEYGHLFEQMERRNFINSGPEPWRKLKEAWNFLHNDLGCEKLDQSDLLPDKWQEGIAKFRSGLGGNKVTGAVFNGVLDNLIGTPLAVAVTPFTSSKAIRDAVGGLDPTGTTQKVMDWIGDNNVTVSMLASAPAIIDELSTMVPGYKNTVNFWKEFNKGEKGLLAGSELLKKSAPLIGKKKPWLEGLKFLGTNALWMTAPFAPVIGAAVGNMFGWNDKKSEDK